MTRELLPGITQKKVIEEYVNPVMQNDLIVKETCIIKIFQIDSSKDKNKVAFKRYETIKEFDFSIYKEVWSGEEPDGCDDLEGIYETFNINRPADFTGHSLSVSDVVQILGSDHGSNGYYYCDSFGWVKLGL